MFQLESIDDLGRKLVFPLVKVKTTLGRDPNCDIVLADADVSRQHARLYTMNEQVKVKDDGSANGTYVNNQRIDAMTTLPIGGELIVGSNQFFLREAAELPDEENLLLTSMLTIDQLREMTKNFDEMIEELPPDHAQMADTMVTPMAAAIENIYQKKISFKSHPSLEVIFGADKGRKFLLTPGEHRLGRGPNCNIRLADPMVSTLHGTIEVEEEEVVFSDEQSRNGSVLNNKIVTTHPLHHRDVLVLGNTKLKYLHPVEAKNDPRPAGWNPEADPGVPWLASYGMWVTVGVAAAAMIVVLVLLYVFK